MTVILVSVYGDIKQNNCWTMVLFIIVHRNGGYFEIILIWFVYKGIRWYNWYKGLPPEVPEWSYISEDDVDGIAFCKEDGGVNMTRQK